MTGSCKSCARRQYAFENECNSCYEAPDEVKCTSPFCFYDKNDENFSKFVINGSLIYGSFTSYIFDAETEKCNICPAGTQKVGNACNKCAQNSISDEGELCQPCLPGYISSADSTICIPCTYGTKRSADEINCTACPHGYTSEKGASSCFECTSFTRNILSKNALDHCDSFRRLPRDIECLEDDLGIGYRGTVDQTRKFNKKDNLVRITQTKYNQYGSKNKRPCRNWKEELDGPRQRMNGRAFGTNEVQRNVIRRWFHENDDMDHSFCRNPDNDRNGPWCYYDDLFHKQSLGGDITEAELANEIILSIGSDGSKTFLNYFYCDIERCMDPKNQIRNLMSTKHERITVSVYDDSILDRIKSSAKQILLLLENGNPTISNDRIDDFRTAFKGKLVYIKSNSENHPLVTQKYLLPKTEDLNSEYYKLAVGCQNGNGWSYKYYAETDRNGQVCQVWSGVGKTQSFYPDERNHNYCRNPDDDVNGPWCYVEKDGDFEKSYCDIPNCDNFKVAGDKKTFDISLSWLNFINDAENDKNMTQIEPKYDSMVFLFDGSYKVNKASTFQISKISIYF